MGKKIIYIDLDGTVCDYLKGCKKIEMNVKEAKRCQGFFLELEPINGALDGINKLINCGKYELYILSTSPWSTPTALTEKLLWCKNNLPSYFKKRIIFSHNKHLNIGDYLIDDSLKNGAEKFTGEHIHFGTEKFPNWDSVVKYLINK